MLQGLKIIQHSRKFCFGMDAVLLSSFVSVKKGGNVLDLGTGTGILPILLSAKTPAGHITGLEIQADCADMAERSVLYNGLRDKIGIVTGDIREAAAIFDAASFDTVVSNPPYIAGNGGLLNPGVPKAIARHEICCSLEDVLAAAEKLLKPGGSFFLVYRPFRLAELLQGMTRRSLEPKRLRFVQQRADKAPALLLLEGRKDGNPGLKVEPVLIVREEDGSYTPEAAEIYGLTK